MEKLIVPRDSWLHSRKKRSHSLEPRNRKDLAIWPELGHLRFYMFIELKVYVVLCLRGYFRQRRR